ncbi:serine hydrolase domain-containing protein [Pseudomonas baetica]|uniref:serine hydrolase domain-containing protein n=1 Tax=Pseudomonas baetica TaxID=674054 RepID=UPI003EEED3F4
MLFALVSNGTLLTPEQPGTTVPWWSFSKTVLAAAALSLVRDGLTGLDETVPEGPFTLRQLLRHEAGLADYSELADYHAAVARHDIPWPADDLLQRLDAGRLRYTPGGGWRYSNVGYLYVARLIQRVTGSSLEEALTRRVFTPLGLTHVRLAKNRCDLLGVDMGGAPDYDPGWVYHGLLVGPLEEAAVCLYRLLSGHLLPFDLLREMQEAHPLGGPIPGRPWLSPGYGLGLMQGVETGGLTLSGHTGSGPGSVVAVYRGIDGDNTASCAVFQANTCEGVVEGEAVKRLSVILKTSA